MENLREKAEKLTEHVKDLLDSYYKLVGITITEKATQIGSAILAGTVMLLLGFFIMFFASLALGWWLGDLLNSRALGFLIVAAFYLLIVIIVFLARRQIVFPFFRNMILRRFYA